MSENVYWTWEADIKPGEEEGFKALAARWEEIAAMDPKTLYSNWTISEDGKSVRVDQRFLVSCPGNACLIDRGHFVRCQGAARQAYWEICRRGVTKAASERGRAIG